DLGKERHVSGVELDNRLDCCLSRARPIAVDVSRDATHWTEVARHEDEFMTLEKSWPTTKARYVRVHVPSPSPAILHLSRVRIFP
ncbi:MAG TPA: discoidin domain-containing protein, partial [Polyangiaceae bacterium]|nr:discoidin domain-containing protein [Polyangiaceae bacterium]